MAPVAKICVERLIKVQRVSVESLATNRIITPPPLRARGRGGECNGAFWAGCSPRAPGHTAAVGTYT